MNFWSSRSLQRSAGRPCRAAGTGTAQRLARRRDQCAIGRPALRRQQPRPSTCCSSSSHRRRWRSSAPGRCSPPRPVRGRRIAEHQPVEHDLVSSTRLGMRSSRPAGSRQPGAQRPRSAVAQERWPELVPEPRPRSCRGLGLRLCTGFDGSKPFVRSRLAALGLYNRGLFGRFCCASVARLGRNDFMPAAASQAATHGGSRRPIRPMPWLRHAASRSDSARQLHNGNKLPMPTINQLVRHGREAETVKSQVAGAAGQPADAAASAPASTRRRRRSRTRRCARSPRCA